MSKVAVVYWSGTGNTEEMAQAVADASSADLFHASEFDADMVADYDAIAFGCPATGTEELDQDEFEPMFDSVKDSLGDTRIALFGSHDWGDGEWMRTWYEDCEAAGLNLIAEGLICHLTPEDEDLEKCRELGEKLASA